MGLHGVFIEVICDEPKCEEMVLKEITIAVSPSDCSLIFNGAVPAGWGGKPGAKENKIFCPDHCEKEPEPVQ